MILPDVNVLIYAHRAESSDHERYRGWLESCLDSERAFGLAELVLSGFLRIVSHPRIFQDPTPIETALRFANDLRERPNCVRLEPGERHWGIFTRLVRESGAKGSLIPDAYFAALAIESGCEWVTTDRDYARFKGLRWRHPLE